MAVRIAFSRNDKMIGSWLIRWGISEGFFSLAPVSHFIAIFDEKLVFESNLERGVHFTDLLEFRKKNTIACSFRLKKELSLQEEEAIYQSLLKTVVGKPYDLSALLYLGWRVFLKKFFNKPLPEDNKFNWNDQFFCVETVCALNKELVEQVNIAIFPQLEADMIDPWLLCQKMKSNPNLEEISGGA